jgi:hypothetical protein
MKTKTFKVPIYDYKVVLVEFEKNENDTYKIARFLKRYLTTDQTSEMIELHEKGSVNGAYTYTNVGKGFYIIVMFHQTCEREKINTLGHEKRHLEDFIIKVTNLRGKEAKGYLSGYLTEKLFYNSNI